MSQSFKIDIYFSIFTSFQYLLLYNIFSSIFTCSKWNSFHFFGSCQILVHFGPKIWAREKHAYAAILRGGARKLEHIATYAPIQIRNQRAYNFFRPWVDKLLLFTKNELSERDRRTIVRRTHSNSRKSKSASKLFINVNFQSFN